MRTKADEGAVELGGGDAGERSDVQEVQKDPFRRGDYLHPFYDKGGRPIGIQDLARLMVDKRYRIVDEIEFPSGVVVKTVWLGLDHSFDEDKKLIFETMVIGRDKKWMHCHRYSTLEEAEAGHSTVVDLCTTELGAKTNEKKFLQELDRVLSKM